MRVGGAGLYPTNGSGTALNATLDIGTAVARFKDLYLSGTVSTGSTTTLTETAGGDTQLTNTNTGADVFLVSGRRLRFSTAGSERARIDNLGNLLVGRTSTTISNLGVTIPSSGAIQATANFNALGLNRLSGDGAIALFQKSGTTVGSIGAVGGATYYGGTTKSLRINTTGFHPATNTGAYSDDTVSLGHSGGRFKDLYLSGKASVDTLQFAQNSSATGVTEAVYRPTTGSIAFKANSNERMRIDSSGNLLVGKTEVALILVHQQHKV